MLNLLKLKNKIKYIKIQKLIKLLFLLSLFLISINSYSESNSETIKEQVNKNYNKEGKPNSVDYISQSDSSGGVDAFNQDADKMNPEVKASKEKIESDNTKKDNNIKNINNVNKNGVEPINSEQKKALGDTNELDKKSTYNTDKKSVENKGNEINEGSDKAYDKTYGNIPKDTTYDNGKKLTLKEQEENIFKDKVNSSKELYEKIRNINNQNVSSTVNQPHWGVKTYLYTKIVYNFEATIYLIGFYVSYIMIYITFLLVLLESILLIFKYLRENNAKITDLINHLTSYLFRSIIIFTLLLPKSPLNFWRFYSTTLRELGFKLGAMISGGADNITYNRLGEFIMYFLLMPIKIIMEALLQILTIVPLINGSAIFLLLLGFMLWGLASECIEELILIIIEFFIVGVCSIITIPLAVLGITKEYSMGAINGTIATVINITVIATLIDLFTMIDDKLFSELFKASFSFNYQVIFGTFIILFLYMWLIKQSKSIGLFIFIGRSNTISGSSFASSIITSTIEAGVTVAIIVASVISFGAAAGAGKGAMVSLKAGVSGAKNAKKGASVLKTATKQVGNMINNDGKMNIVDMYNNTKDLVTSAAESYGAVSGGSGKSEKAESDKAQNKGQAEASKEGNNKDDKNGKDGKKNDKQNDDKDNQ